jgi:hypothetical protein
MAPQTHNPFHTGEHVTGADFTDRADEVARIRRGLLGAGRLLVYGPRRMGKSSAIAVASEGARREGAVVIRADVSTVTTYLDITSRLLRSLYEETRSLRVRLEELVQGVAPKVTVSPGPPGGPPSITFGVERRSAEDEQRRSVETVVERLSGLAQRLDSPAAVVLDEFQAIRGLGGEVAEWHLRDVIQRSGGLGFVCAGSQESLIHEMIGPKRAFYKMLEPVHIGPMPRDHFASWLEDRLATAGDVERGVGEEILRRSGPRTQDAVVVARQLWFRARGLTRPAGSADVEAAFDDVVRNEDPIIRALWNELPGHQQDVLRVVALGAEQLYSAETRDRYGLPAASSVQRAVGSLIGRGLLVRSGDEIVFDSPFVEAWVGREVAPDLGREVED